MAVRGMEVEAEGTAVEAAEMVVMEEEEEEVVVVVTEGAAAATGAAEATTTKVQRAVPRLGAMVVMVAAAEMVAAGMAVEETVMARAVGMEAAVTVVAKGTGAEKTAKATGAGMAVAATVMEAQAMGAEEEEVMETGPTVETVKTALPWVPVMLKQECILNGPTWADDPEMILMCMCGDLEEDEVQFTTTSDTKKGKERKKSSTSGAPEAFPKKGRANETKVKTGVDTLSAMRAGRAGHCAAPVDSRLGVMIIGGLSLTQEMAQYDGDTVYHDDVFWMSTEWDQNKRRIKASRMQWWGPLKFPGPKLSARAHLSCDKVSLGRGAASVGAILTFGGYNGKGRCCGYFNDLHALINVERKRADINRIMEWMRKLQLDDLTFMTRARQNHTGPAESPYMDYDVNKKKIDLLDKKEVKRLFDQCKNKGQRACKMMFNKDLPPPWSDHKQWQEFADKRGDALLEVEEPAAGQTKESRMMGMANPWPWDGWEEQPLWYPVSAKGRPPSPRAKHSTATIGSLFFVFGGFGPEGFLDDLHVLNVETIRWLRTGRLIKVDDRGNPDDGSPTWLASKVKFLNDPKVVLGHPPSARAGHAATAMMGRIPGELECDLWEGAGKELDVLAHGNLQVTIAGNKLFSYNPPEIVAVIRSM
eukprot:g562.t1